MIVIIAGAGLMTYRFAFNNKKSNGLAESSSKNENSSPAIPDTSHAAQPSSAENSKNEGLITKEPAADKSKTKSGSDVETGRSAGKFNTDSTYSGIKSGDRTTTVVTAPAKIPEEKEKKDAADLKVSGRNEDASGEVSKQKPGIDNYRTLDKAKEGATAPAGNNRNEVAFKLDDRKLAEKRQGPEQIARPNIFRGRVTDADNNGLPFANVTSTEDNVGTYADAKGYFNLTAPDTVLHVQVRSIGFNDNTTQLRNTQAGNQVIMQEDKSVNGLVLSNKKINAEARSRDVFMKAEESEPADGWEYYDTYLANNLKVPGDFKTKQNTGGEVLLSFEVDKNGEPANIKVEKSLCRACDKEAIRLVKQGPRWKHNAKKGRTTVTIAF
jgi:hypothetical protein